MEEQSDLQIARRVVRRGVPFTLYFTAEQAEALAAISRTRRVSKSTVIRFAVERLLKQIESEQLELPLGL
jgi:hypothetical protein